MIPIKLIRQIFLTWSGSQNINVLMILRNNIIMDNSVNIDPIVMNRLKVIYIYH